VRCAGGELRQCMMSRTTAGLSRRRRP
jgi:hypothetical protein